MKNNLRKFDVAVVGGGPAGIMAAGRAAELGAKVVLIEKNKSLGRKLLITGKGRCNITQAEFNDKKFIEKLGKKGRFLFSSFNLFGPGEVIDFLEKRGLKTKTERGGRVFPISDKSVDVANALIGYLKENKVEIILGEEVFGFELHDKKIKSIKLKDKSIEAEYFIIATGGKSYPVTGSTGNGFDWAKELGHTVVDLRPSLVPIKTKESWVKNLQGLSLKNVRLNVFQKGKKKDSRFGEMIFTHFGLSGPIILDASKKIGELLEDGEVMVEIDLKPALDLVHLNKRLQRDFEENRKKSFKNYLPELLPQKMVGTFLSLSGIDPEKKLHFINKEKRNEITHLLKGLRTTVEDLMGYDQAIITSGGVSTKEVDSKTMRSKIITNLSFAGEILDIDGPTGGYNLQICWSTGYAAGTFLKSSFYFKQSS